MTRCVINVCYGGFGLSDAGIERYAELKGIPLYKEKGVFGCRYYTIPIEEVKKLQEDREYGKVSEVILYDRRIMRDDPVLVRVVEELGKKSWGECAELKIVEIPDDIEWDIDDYDGMERVVESHRGWC